MSQNGLNRGENGKLPNDLQASCNLTKINDTYYLATNEGVYKSNDLHKWHSLDGGFFADRIEQNPVKIDGNYYIADGSGVESGGIYTSKDGEDWNLVDGINPMMPISLSPVKINGIYYEIDSPYGLFTSQDGLTWNRDDAVGLPTLTNMKFLPVKIANTYYLPVYNNAVNWVIYTSQDGVHWSKMFPSGFPTNIDYNFFQSAPAKIGSMYYLLTAKGLYLSEDGINWKRDTHYPTPYQA